MIKVLYILNNLDLCNGIVSYSMNYYLQIHKFIKVDFLISDSIPDNSYTKMILDNKDKIFTLPQISYKNIFNFNKEVNKIFKEHNDYDIVHCHVANVGLIYLKYAKQYNIPVRILHAHATKSSDNVINKLRNDIVQPMTNKLANVYLACSQMAGDAVFKKKNFSVIHNAIDKNKYVYNESIRKVKRKELNITNQFVVGTVGRIAEQKNPMFIIQIFNEIIKINNNSLLIYVGNGPLYDEVVAKSKQLGIYENICFLKDREDVNELYQAMDAFLLPSLYEGLPVVGIEAQCASLPLFVSTSITKELKIVDTTTFISLNETPYTWAQSILQSVSYERKEIEEFEHSKYDIYREAEQLISFYMKYKMIY